MNSQDVCHKLLRAESEKEVDNIIRSVPEFYDKKNWKPLDGRETNFNVTSNQASDGGKALTELMTNMVDAILLKHAYEKNVETTGPKAPKTMYEAVDKLVKNLRGGKLVNLDSKDPWLRDFAQKNLVIGITGASTKKEGLPCYTFVDNGEGQAADRFESTFLSLSEGNKKSIPFVQGKFNMGSSGVLRYCGRQGYKFILSRRYDKQHDWAWTILRRRPNDGDELPIAEYFILESQGIPTFKCDYIYPFQTMSEEIYDAVLISSGSIIKLYDYQIGSRYMSFRGAREAFLENLVETILPFRIMDFRYLPKSKKGRESASSRGDDRMKGIDPRPFYGMEFLLLNSHKEEDMEEVEAIGEKKIDVENIKDPELGEISIDAIVLKSNLPSWLKPNNSINRVFHAVNGQVQFKQSRGFIAQQCKLPALKDRLIIIVDASGLKFKAHNDIWKGDREHISNTITGEKYREKVMTAIRGSEKLKNIQAEIARKELDRASKAESNQLFQELVSADRNLASLLSKKDPKLNLPYAAGKAQKSDDGLGEWNKGKYSPTFLRLEEKFKEQVINVPINRSKTIIGNTDAQNDYFIRPDNQGQLIISDTVLENKFGIRNSLLNGQLTVIFDPLESELNVGDKFSFNLELKDDAMSHEVKSESINFFIVEQQTEASKKSSGSTKSKRKSGEEKGKHKPDENVPTLGLPNCILLTKDGRGIEGYSTEPWREDMTELDGGIIEQLDEEEIVYKINYDNVYHIQYRFEQKDRLAADVVSEKYILGMRILMIGFEHAYQEIRKKLGDSYDGIEEFSDEIRRMAARGAASTVLALAENLPKIVDKSTISEDVE